MTRGLGKTVIRVADLPKVETETTPIILRLSDFLRELRQRGTEGERARTDVPPPDGSDSGLLESDSRNELPKRPRFSESGSLSRHDRRRIRKRAERIVELHQKASGTTHLKEEEAKAVQGLMRLPATTVASEDAADVIAATLHAEMPWMAPATDAVWITLRRSARQGEPLRIGPLLIHRPPGMGKTAWARRVARAIGSPECLIDASMGLASFSLVGVERG